MRKACVYNLLCLFLYETANPIVNLVLMCVVTERQYGNIVWKFLKVNETYVCVLFEQGFHDFGQYSDG